MTLPVTKKIPAEIAAYTKPTGKLPASTLSKVDGIGDFVEPAARSLRALKAAALADGIVVKSVGDYRSYEEQVHLFEQRYSPNVDTGRCYSWEGARWCLKPHTAGAAYPGTSNHGLGIANDMAELINGDIVSVSFDPPGSVPSLWTWLVHNGPTYGWYWGEAPSEAWHWVYCAGDDIPAAVLAYENPDPNLPPPLKEGPEMFIVNVADSGNLHGNWVCGNGHRHLVDPALLKTFTDGNAPVYKQTSEQAALFFSSWQFLDTNA